MTPFTFTLLMATLLAGTSGSDIVIGILGNSVSIDCKLPITENVVWETASRGIIVVNRELLPTDTTKYTIESYTGTRETLVIRNVTLTDETEYKCYGIHNKDEAYSTKLNVLARPSVMNITYPKSPVLEGDEVILVCEAGGAKPLPELTWYTKKNGLTTILKGSESRTQYSNGTGYITSILKLTATRDFMIQHFFCNISVPVFYTESLSVNIDVHFIPQTPVIRGYYGSFDENSLVRLECISAGNYPTPTVFWLVNGSRVSDTEYIISPETHHTTTVTSYLNRRLSRAYDGSIVACVVTNSVMMSKGLKPAITDITLRMSYKPKVNMMSKELTVKNGGNVTIQCEIDALPVPDLSIVYWTHNGNIIAKDKYELMNNGTILKLHLTDISRTDAGTYTCHAANRIGTSSDSAELKVTYTPRCSMVEPKRVPAKIGSTVRLDCKMYAYPVSVMLFWRNRSTQETITSFPAKSDNRYDEMVIGSIDFKITDASRYTTIECIGTNTEIGPIQPCLYVIEPPSPAEAPRNCTARTSNDHVTVTCISGFDGGSQQTFILQTKVENTFKTISYHRQPEFGFTTKENVTIRVCSMNEDFKDVHKCSSLLAANVFLKDNQGDNPVEAREDNSALYATIGITIFISLLIVTAIVILLLRNRRKTVSSRTSPIAEVLSSRRNPNQRMNFGGKWWNKLKPTKTIIPRDSYTPAGRQGSREPIQIVCSTPYCINKQPDIHEVGDSPILPDDRTVTDTSSISSRLNCNRENTEVVLSPLAYNNLELSFTEGVCKRTDKDCLKTGHENNGKDVKDNAEDTKSIDLLAVTLYKDYTAGDIADVLDQTEQDFDKQTNTYKRFNLNTHMSNFVINGTTLSFDVDYSESDFYGTMSDLSSPIANSSENQEMEYVLDHETNPSNSIHSANGSSVHTSGSSEVKTIMDQTFTVTQLHNSPCGTSKAEEYDFDLNSSGLQDESFSSIRTYVESPENHIVDINDAFVDMDQTFSDSEENNTSKVSDVCNCNTTLCDIDQYTLVITDESSMYSAGKSFNFNNNTSQSFNFGNTTKSSSSSAHRNDSFRTAIDNSAVTRSYTDNNAFIEESENIQDVERVQVVKATQVNIVDETFPRPFSVASSTNYVEESTLNLTTVINDVKDRTLAFI